MVGRLFSGDVVAISAAIAANYSEVSLVLICRCGGSTANLVSTIRAGRSGRCHGQDCGVLSLTGLTRRAAARFISGHGPMNGTSASPLIVCPMAAAVAEDGRTASGLFIGLILTVLPFFYLIHYMTTTVPT